MTKAEVIRKFAKRAGVPDSEAKIFFEIFLKKLSLQLNPGESVKVKSFGYFQLKTGKVKNIPSAEPEFIYSDIIIFYSLRDDSDFSENIIFNIPSDRETEYDLIDSYFSLSIGKPVIPLTNAQNTEFFIPPSGNELRRLVEFKVDKLLSEVEVIEEYAKGNETLLISSDDYNKNQMEINWDEKLSERKKITKETEPEKKKEDEEIISAWDFGDDLEKELEEESILDIEKDDIDEPSGFWGDEEEGEREEKESEENKEAETADINDLSWDFGKTIWESYTEESETPEEIPYEEETNKTEKPDEDIHDIRQLVKEIKTQQEPVEEKKEFETIEWEEEKFKNFERVKSLTPSTRGWTEDLSWDFNNSREGFKYKTDVEESGEDKDGFKEIKLRSTRYEFPTDVEEETKGYIFDDEIKAPAEDEILTTDYEYPAPEPYAEPEKTADYEHVTVETREYMPAEKLTGFRKRKGIGFFVLFSIILLLTAGYYLYMKIMKNMDKGKREIAVETVIPAPSVIERNFDIPVTYPYSKEGNGVKPVYSGIAPSVLAQNNEIIPLQNETKTDVPVETKINPPVETKEDIKSEKKTEEKEIVKTPPVKIEEKSITVTDPGLNEETSSGMKKVADFIYQAGNNYLVQISSWPNEDDAERQVLVYKEMGYNSFTERTVIGGKTWYRVKVGNFDSVSDAQQFFNSYK